VREILKSRDRWGGLQDHSDKAYSACVEVLSSIFTPNKEKRRWGNSDSRHTF
jgi:hypothetical protein